MIYAIISRTTSMVLNVIDAPESYRARLVQIYDPREVVSAGRSSKADTAAPGYYYNKQGRYFVPYKSWTIDQNGEYKQPVPYPNDGKDYVWDESILNWKLVTKP